MRLRQVREIDGKTYYLSLEYRTKAEAKRSAEQFRKLGYGARVIKLGYEWAVYATRVKVRKGGR